MKSYEKLGAFYLGRRYEAESGATTPEPILYDARDLTTHAVCVGMTGSGKTGLCLGLLEEAALDGIPVLAIDPKGDLGNLLLTFPRLEAEEFRPWVDEGEAARRGRNPDEYARDVAKLWKEGLTEWDQDGERIRRLREAADAAIYTPGSTAGLPLNVLRSLAAPSETVRRDADALRERVQASVSGMLALLGIQGDALRSREHILLQNIVEAAWRAGESLDVPALIRAIQKPPFEQVGVFDLESFYPEDERLELAMTLNNLVASPGFAAWMEGEPLEIPRMLWTAEGRPRISIFSIAHLSEQERMFFVTVLLNELLAWVRSQPGTTSLRAILYMDEVYGYFPPVANPPSKRPMLTLLKQARAYGLGCVLATQNPVDLDYKGLSNTGTWFLGRLQTERDKTRVLDGLEGAAAVTGTALDRSALERILSGLPSRVFLMHNVHEDAPVLFHTRWVLSYLRGPLTRAQIKQLMEPRKLAAARQLPPTVRPGRATEAARATPVTEVAGAAPSGVREAYLPVAASVRAGDSLLYRPALLGQGSLHFVDSRAGFDVWQNAALFFRLKGEVPENPWESAVALGELAGRLEDGPDTRGRLAELPGAAARKKSYTLWNRLLKDHLYQTYSLPQLKCAALKLASKAGETEGEFRARLAEAARERRDLEIEKLRSRYNTKFERMQDRILRAEHRVEREKSQYDSQKLQAAISLGATVLGALLGRKTVSTRSVGRATTTARGMGRAARERGDISRAEETLEDLKDDLKTLEREFETEAGKVRDRWAPDALAVAERRIRPRKSDISVQDVGLLWTPWRVDPEGIAEPAWERG